MACTIADMLAALQEHEYHIRRNTDSNEDPPCIGQRLCFDNHLLPMVIPRFESRISNSNSIAEHPCSLHWPEVRVFSRRSEVRVPSAKGSLPGGVIDLILRFHSMEISPRNAIPAD